MSKDLSNWIKVVEGQLINAYSLGCNVPLQTFNPTSVEIGRYVRFTIKTFHGAGGGLKLLDWDV